MPDPSTNPATPGASVVVGRQGVYDRDQEVVGYELTLAALNAAVTDAAQRPGRTVEDALNAGIDRLVGDKRLFLAADRALLDNPTLAQLPAESVLQVGPEVVGDEALLQACRRLADEGHTIALDGIPWLQHTVLPLPASIAQVDLRTVALGELAALHEHCRARGLDLLLTHADTPVLRDAALAAGVELLQGYAVGALGQANGSGGAVLNPGRLRAAAKVLGERLDFDEIEDLLRTEPTLTYQVLQLASLGRMGEPRRHVDSVRRALVLAGSWRVQSWMAFLLTSGEEGSGDGVVPALARARACELLAPEVGADSSFAFTAGMIASFEQLVHVPSAELEQSLPLSPELREAAFGTDSALGRLVQDVGDRIARVDAGTRSGLDDLDYDVALAAGIDWALEACSMLG